MNSFKRISTGWDCVLLMGSLIGTNFNVAPGIYWADFFCAVLGMICICRLGLKRWKGDLVSNLTLGYIGFLAVSSLINQTYGHTQFQNYFRIFLCGWIVYVFLRNSLHTNDDIRMFSIMFILYSIFFLMYSRTSLLKAMSEVNNNFYMLDFGYGRNNWGFTNLLHIIFLSFILYKVKLSNFMKI